MNILRCRLCTLATISEIVLKGFSSISLQTTFLNLYLNKVGKVVLPKRALVGDGSEEDALVDSFATLNILSLWR